MAKIKNNSNTRVSATFKGGGEVVATIKWLKNSTTFLISSPALLAVSRDELQDFAEAVRLVCKAVGSKVKKTVNVKGTVINPDEPTQVPNTDLKVDYVIFPKDKRYKLSFVRYCDMGQVRAQVRAFSFSNDIPSAIQVASVASQAAVLMKAYEEIA